MLKANFIILLLCLNPLPIFAEPLTKLSLIPKRPVATYSILARDSSTGQLGVAVQSHWFSVGPVVPWAEAGVGAVATQSLVDISYGPLGLDLMRAGKSASDALNALLASDPGRDVRQVAMIDAQGQVSAHTGQYAIREAGHQIGKAYSVQANLMEHKTVWPAMAKAYENASGDLAERLLQALEAAQAEGGDIRGKQSAAILIVSGKNTGRPWVDRLFDLRVEDHPNPLKELRRLVRFARAYHKLNEGDEWVTRKNIKKAMAAYKEATAIVSDEEINGEASFWVGVTLADSGRIDEAIDYLRRAYRQDKRWVTLLLRLPDSRLLPNDHALLQKLSKAMQQSEP